jgi:hypothetical protein
MLLFIKNLLSDFHFSNKYHNSNNFYDNESVVLKRDNFKGPDSQFRHFEVRHFFKNYSSRNDIFELPRGLLCEV